MLNFNEKIYSNISYLGCASEYIEDIWESIDQIDLFQTFTLDEVKAVCHYLHCYAAPRGYMLFEPEYQADHLILVLSGGVSVTEVRDGVEDSMEFLLGATLGESALVDQQPWHATCVAMVPTDFAVLSRQALNEMLVNYPRLANKLLLVLMQKIALRLRSVDKTMQHAHLRFA